MAVTCCLVLASATVMMALMSTAYAQDRPLPDFIKVCKRHDPELNSCIKNTVEELRGVLKTGVEGFIPSLEPLLIKEIVVTEGSGFRIVGKDVKAYGASDFVLSNLQADMETLDFEFDLDFPMLYVLAEYDVNGKVLLIPIRGNGPLRGNFTECKAHVKLDGELKDDFMYFTNLDITLSVGKGVVKLDNLFGGEKLLGDAVNSAINANFQQFLKELRHPIEKALEESLLEIARDCVRGFTRDQLSPL